MSQYGIIRSLFMSFFSKKLYRDVAVNWGGKALLYLFIVLGLSWGWTTYQAQKTIADIYTKKLSAILPQIPVLTITNGKISTPESRPYEITLPDSNAILAIVDTSGRYNSLDDVKSAILVTEDKIMLRQTETEGKTVTLPNNANAAINPDAINDFLKQYISLAWVPVFVISILLSFFAVIIISLVNSLIGLIFANIFRVNLTYGQVYKMSFVALTPALAAAALLSGLHITVPNELLALLGLTLLYLFRGVIANKN